MKKISLLMMSLLLAGCATLFSSSKDTITFKSQPSGANVYLDSKLLGKTPLTYTIDRDTFNTPEITLRKKGYKTTKFKLRKEFTAIAVLNLSSLLSWATDVISGNVIKYAPDSYFTELESKRRKRSSLLTPMSEEYAFLFKQYENIRNDIAKNGGEYLDEYVRTNKGISKEKILKNAPQVLKKTDHIEFHKNILSL